MDNLMFFLYWGCLVLLILRMFWLIAKGKSEHVWMMLVIGFMVTGYYQLHKESQFEKKLWVQIESELVNYRKQVELDYSNPLHTVKEYGDFDVLVNANKIDVKLKDKNILLGRGRNIPGKYSLIYELKDKKWMCVIDFDANNSMLLPEEVKEYVKDCLIEK